jgi:DNA replication protein DnaC
LAKCIAYAATQAGIKTLFTTAMDMINHLIAAEVPLSAGLKKLQFYQSPDILVCDELCKALHNSSYDKLNVM